MTTHTTGSNPEQRDPAAERTRRCSTLSGNPIDPHDAIGAALIDGHFHIWRHDGTELT